MAKKTDRCKNCASAFLILNARGVPAPKTIRCELDDQHRAEVDACEKFTPARELEGATSQ